MAISHPSISTVKIEILRLVFNFIVTLCAEAISFVHSVTLKCALLGIEYQLVSAANKRAWASPDDTLMNFLI